MVSERDFLVIAGEELGLTPDAVMQYTKMEHYAADRMLAEAWKRLNPQTEEEVINYYTRCPEFTYFHLRFAYGMSEKWVNQQFFDKMIKLMPDIRSYKILDYGCGSCQAGLSFINSGCGNVVMADLGLPLFRIMRRLLSPSIGQNRFMEINKKFPLIDRYDLIVCIDVLEHVKHPHLVLKHLVEHINPDRYLYLETFFGGSDYAPYHLADNNQFNDTDTWKTTIAGCGLVPVLMNDVGGLNGLYKVQRA